ncbi:hypothetical protein LX36DRAFT_657008 [Colletotrichum falcatum]|nr:hypothetical protein LX36DRAFT_657008 [Colletotrichum falcatum]
MSLISARRAYRQTGPALGFSSGSGSSLAWQTHDAEATDHGSNKSTGVQMMRRWISRSQRLGLLMRYDSFGGPESSPQNPSATVEYSKQPHQGTSPRY